MPFKNSPVTFIKGLKGTPLTAVSKVDVYQNHINKGNDNQLNKREHFQ